jgi:serine/threonine protein phosphatase PrpC
MENNAPPSEPLMPLETGTVLLDRYTVLQVLSTSDTAIEYQVAATRACPACGVENQGDAAACGFCGTPLPEPKRLRLVEQYAPRDARQLPPATFIIDQYAYTLQTDTPAPRASSFHFTYGAQTDVGLKRRAQGEPNQDSIGSIVLDTQGAHTRNLALFMVADGVGGAAAGDVASQWAVQILTREWLNKILLPVWNGDALTDEAIRAALRAGFDAANERLLEYQAAHAVQIGTTLTAVLILDAQAYVINVGDSRTYLYRDNTFAPVTRDHSYVATLIANGMLSPEDAYYHPQRNIILASLGDASSAPDIFPQDSGAFDVQPGDQWLLCSDGLWELVRDPDIQFVLDNAPDAQTACAELVQRANTAGGTDNISVIVIRCNAR